MDRFFFSNFYFLFLFDFIRQKNIIFPFSAAAIFFRGRRIKLFMYFFALYPFREKKNYFVLRIHFECLLVFIISLRIWCFFLITKTRIRASADDGRASSFVVLDLKLLGIGQEVEEENVIFYLWCGQEGNFSSSLSFLMTRTPVLLSLSLFF